MALPCSAAEQPYIASMGIYVMKAEALKDLLLEQMPEGHDFGNEIIPEARKKGYKVQAHAFEGYWEDIGTVEAFYNSNIALTDPNNPNFRSEACAVHLRRVGLGMCIYM